MNVRRGRRHKEKWYGFSGFKRFLEFGSKRDWAEKIENDKTCLKLGVRIIVIVSKPTVWLTVKSWVWWQKLVLELKWGPRRLRRRMEKLGLELWIHYHKSSFGESYNKSRAKIIKEQSKEPFDDSNRERLFYRKSKDNRMNISSGWWIQKDTYSTLGKNI